MSVVAGSMGLNLDEYNVPSILAKVGVTVVVIVLAYIYRNLLTVQYPQQGSAMWGFVAIPQGERWNSIQASGVIQTVQGPKVIIALGAKLIKLDLYTASHNQYLWVQSVEGVTEIKPGPFALYKDTSIHKELKVLPATNLTENEVLVVYRAEDGAEKGEKGEKGERKIARHIIRGPCLHVPRNATEWAHEFSWHGSVSNDPEGNARKIKGATRFQKMRVCPEQTYFDVEGVRTRDDALVTVKLMLFYRVVSIETMLRETHDPVADFVNALSSDIIDFVAARSFEEFKGSVEKLNELDLYKQLTSRAKGIGFDVTKVVFRGYGAPSRLQKMHDDAIERRTKLALERETEDQEQQLQDMQLERQEMRNQKKREAEIAQSEHQRKLQRTEHEAKMAEQQDMKGAKLKQLTDLKEKLGLTSEQLAEYLVALETGPPAKLIQITGKDGGGFIHLGEPSA